MYNKEKRRLEMQMLKDYEANKITMKILEHSSPSPKPRYRHLEITDKYQKLLKQRAKKEYNAREKSREKATRVVNNFYEYLQGNSTSKAGS